MIIGAGTLFILLSMPFELELIEKPDIKMPGFDKPKFSFGADNFNVLSTVPHYVRVAGAFTSESTFALIPSAEPSPTSLPSATPTPTPIPIEEPVRIEIPAISVATNIVQVGVTPDNIMEIPEEFTTVGWYKNGVKPGEQGAAILNGHYDTTTGHPAVFFSISQLNMGDEIYIFTKDEKQLTFIVDTILSHPLEDFPKDIVYGEFEGKGIKLITCDGIWNPAKRSYTNRLVVTAYVEDGMKENIK